MDNKSSKIIAIVALVVAVVGLSVGFAAFSSVLTIESSAEVTPEASTFEVGFSVSDTDLVGGEVAPTVTGNATADKVTLANDGTKATITGLKANFVQPGQTATYSFYVYNNSPYAAYLKEISLADGQEAKACTIPTTSAATQGLVTAACGDISLTVEVGEDTFTGTTVTPNTLLSSETGVPVTVTIAYNGTNRADGPFNVEFGNVELTYSTAQ